MINCCEISDLCNATVDTSMFQSKVADHIQLGCGLGSSHPVLLLELQLLYVIFIIKLDKLI
eukprot:10716658-Prorocentrum_lima.AAC.1